MTAREVQQTKTRPANTTAYAIGDVINESASAGTIWTFPGVGSASGGSLLLTNAKLILGSAAATALQAELFLFSTTVSTDNDNAADTITDAEMKTCIGSVLFNSGSNSTAQTVYVEKPGLQFKLDDGDNDLYGVLIAQNAYTPESGEVFDIALTTLSLG